MSASAEGMRLITSLPHYPITSLPHLPHYLNLIIAYSITPLPHYPITPLPHYPITPLPHYLITSLPHYSPTVSQRYLGQLQVDAATVLFEVKSEMQRRPPLRVLNVGICGTFGSERIGMGRVRTFRNHMDPDTHGASTINDQ